MASYQTEEGRGEWNSKIGFILASAGSAIGLGNIWRFPYLVGENGGAAFVLLYLFFILIIGLPYLLAEFSLGRRYNLNPVGAINTIKPNSSWRFVGGFGIVTGFLILSFYGVIAGWTFGYIFKTMAGDTSGFGDFISNPFIEIFLFAFFIFMTALIVNKGVSGGIEKWSKILMPLMLILLLGLIIYANLQEGASEGLAFYLMPDFTKVEGSTILAALGQAFFSLSLGMGLMITYGSYVSKKENMVSSAIYIGLFDTLIAVMAGLIIFPALFAMGESPAAGPSLVFVVLPQMFASMPAGVLVGTLFFVLLSIAALTSTISLLEVPVAYMVDQKKAKRSKVVWIAAGAAFLIGIPSALSQGSVDFFSNFGVFPSYLSAPDFLSHVSFFAGDFSLPFGALLLSIFIGWIWGAKNAADEIEIGSPGFRKYRNIWEFMIRWFIPVIIFIILLNIFGVFGR